MIPPPDDNDGDDVHHRYRLIASGAALGIDGDRYYGYEPDLKIRVIEHFRKLGLPVDRHHVELHSGLFEDTLHPAAPVALAHIDGDWYRAVNDFFASRKAECRFERRARLHIVKL
jgi:asparagine synthase (glutamine-hydrolysing)